MERVFVTGLGAVSPFGLGIERLWRGLESGAAAIRDVDLFDASVHRTHLAGQLKSESAAACAAFLSKPHRATRTDRLALEAVREALEHAGLAPGEVLREAGVFFGTSTGGMFEGERVYEDVVSSTSGPAVRLRFLQLAGQPLGSAAEAIARAFRMHGPIETSGAACAASTMALETALCSLRDGEVDIAIAGGADGLCGLTYGGFNSLRAISPSATRPFRLGREGLSLGEGAAAMVLEVESHARRRGARVLAEVAGTGSSCDAHHMTAPHPEGAGAQLAMRRALEDAGVTPAEVDFVNAHGTGTPHNDAAEWSALSAVFGERAADVLVTSTKGAVGHLLGACGALEAVATILCLSNRSVHPTPGHGEVDPACPVNLVVEVPRRLERARTALSVNLAFGGANAAVVLRVPDEVRSIG